MLYIAVCILYILLTMFTNNTELLGETVSIKQWYICSEFRFVIVYVYKPELLVKFAPESDAALRYLLWHVSKRLLTV